MNRRFALFKFTVPKSHALNLALFLGGCAAALGCSDAASSKAEEKSGAAAPVAAKAVSAAPTVASDDAARDELALEEIALHAAESHAGHWPRFRGAKLNGISPETDWEKEWAAAPRALWKASIGTGYSSVSVARGKLYTMGHADGNDTVFCFDAESGELNWKHSYPCALVDNLHDGGPAATPTIAGEFIYTLSKEGHFFCLNANTGEVVWNRELPADLGVAMPAWGFSSSPLVWGELIYVDGGRTAAYRRANGELVWKSEKFKPGYGSVAAMRAGDRECVVVLNNEVLLVLDRKDGTEIAKTPWETSFETNAATPLVEGDTIFISTGYNRGCALLKLVGDKLEYLYENKHMRNHMNNCVLWEGHLYGVDGNSHQSRLCTVVCLDAATGEPKWSERGLGCGSLMLADGHLIVLSDEGELVVAPASPEGFKPRAKSKILDGTCWTVPVLAGGRIYARNARGDLVCIDVRKRNGA